MLIHIHSQRRDETNLSSINLSSDLFAGTGFISIAAGANAH